MHIHDIVEISRSNDCVPAKLIEVSYRASQDHLIGLVLHGISPQMVNLILDPIVPTLPLNIPGVLYIDAGDEKRVREAVLSAETIFVATATFRGLVRRWGVAPRMIVPVSHVGQRRRCVAKRIGNGRAAKGSEPAGNQSAHGTEPAVFPSNSQAIHSDPGPPFAL
ncbi:hypothetical protein [Chelativorans salis]|uniref:Uncharacterized protein n=1 Tax=Chelativorans salis TaxID=2978478 RepID=A0ABT2LRD9_9HYPH|nr:hypothetical protein [Chelativorans sp. EGI FJ00035]MCT7376921.1 hypothetical protein [Chelativorans sp. EGI FJ00035]